MNGSEGSEAPEAPRVPSRRPIEVGRVIGEAFEAYRANFGPLILTALIVFFAFGIVASLIYDSGGVLAQILGSIVRVIGTALYTGFVVKLVEDVRDGRRDFSTGELVSSALPAVGALIINSILLGIGVGVGLILLIVPGLILLTIWAVCAPAIVAEDRGAFEAFGRSYELVKGQGMKVFLTILVAFLIQLAVAVIATAIGAAIGLGGLIIFGILAAALTAPISALVAAILFFDLGGGAPPRSEDSQVVVEY